MEGSTHSSFDYSQTESFWKLLREEMLSLKVKEPLANMANFSSLIFHQMPDLNWCGFYIYDGEKLVLGPFQGRTACVYISLDRGVCGKSAREKSIQIIPDVHQFPGHIACDARSRSELVIPIFEKDGTLFGVLDLDSPSLGRFSETDAEHLSSLLNEVFAF